MPARRSQMCLRFAQRGCAGRELVEKDLAFNAGPLEGAEARDRAVRLARKQVRAWHDQGKIQRQGGARRAHARSLR